MNTKLILIVEDDPDIAIDIKRTLVNSQLYDVINVYNGKEALEFFESDIKAADITCIVLDFKMPIMDGPQFLKKFRHSDLPNRTLPIVVLTAYEDKEKWFAASYTQGRALAYLKKDMLKTNLLPTLERIFSGETTAMAAETDELALEKIKILILDESAKNKKILEN